MKTRNGFVSNSSSSSFLVMCNDDGVFDCLKESKGYKTFIGDVRSNINDKSRIIEFLADEYCGILDEYAWHLRNRDRRFSDNNVKPFELDFADICRRVHNENPKVNEIINEGARLEEEAVKDEEKGYADWGRIEELARQFAELLYEEAVRHWSIISVFGYSDNDGDFWDYMEHDFMYGELARKESKTFDDFAVVIKNEH
jgi:hypothetical protein